MQVEYGCNPNAGRICPYSYIYDSYIYDITLNITYAPQKRPHEYQASSKAAAPLHLAHDDKGDITLTPRPTPASKPEPAPKLN